MRPEAKFHDGSRMTAHDVAFTLNLLKEEGPPDHRPADARYGRRRGYR
jgi:ABC-type transport system substrate-binding protein